MKKLLTIGIFILLIFSVHTVHADTLPSGCLAGDNFSSTTGYPCTLPDCNPGDLFSGIDGHRCSTTAYLPGCYSINGYSVTTGHKCDGSDTTQPITNNPAPTGNTNTQPMNNQSDSTDNTQPVSSTVAPIQLTPQQIQENALNALVVQIREKYPNAYFVQGFLSNGKAGTYMVENQGSTNKVAELIINDDGSVNINWTDGSTNS